jgi:hypothetical protein
MASSLLQSIRCGTRVFARGEGSVLHYSSRAVNFLFGGSVVTLLTRNGILSPSSVVVDTSDFPAAKKARVAGDVFLTDGFRVALGNFRDLGIDERVPVDKKWVARMMAPYIFAKKKSISTALLMSAGRDFQLAGFEKAVAERQLRALESSDDLPGLARDLLGLGFGLTPSGDDFVLGMIAIGRLLGEDVERVRPVVEEYDNPYSRTILRDALDGYYSEPVYALLRSIIDGSLSGSHINGLLKVGSLSGHDTLAGMFYCLGSNGELCSHPHISDYNGPEVGTMDYGRAGR